LDKKLEEDALMEERKIERKREGEARNLRKKKGREVEL